MNQQPQQPNILDDARKTGSFVVALIHASIVPLRLFSRVPGSMGAGYLFPNILWGFACMGVVEALSNQQSGAATFYFVQLAGWAWVVHLAAYFRSHWKGQGAYSHDLGRPWFAGSDLIVAAGLAMLAFHLNDPALAAWFVANLFLVVLSEALIAARDGARQRQVRSAIQLQRYYQSLVQQALNAEDDLE